jgi:two-component system, cell cycle sensor histidine kinase and response regulator CckA
MLWQWSLGVITELLASAILLVLAIYFPWRDISRRARLTGVTLVFVCALWILSHAIEIGLSAGSYKESLMGAQLVLGIIAATLSLFYIFHYFGPRKLPSWRIYILFGIVPLITILAILTNNIYGLMWTGIGLNIQNPYLPLRPNYGMVYMACMVYASVLTLTGSFLLIWNIIRRRYSYSRESIFLLVAAILPMIIAFISVMDLFSFLKISVGLESWAACIVAIILILNLPKFRSEQITPVTRDVIIQRIGDCILVLDMQNRVLDLNPAAEQLVGYRISDAFGLSIDRIWPYETTQMIPFNELAKTGEEFVFERDGKQRTYELRISTISESDGRLTNQVVLLTDITERKQVESALQESEQSYRRLADYHKRLNDISIAFAETPNTEDLLNKIAEDFRLLTGAIASTFSVYNQESHALKVVSMSIDPVSRDKVSSIFGPGLFEMQMPVSEDAMEQMLSQVIRRPKDLHELSFGVISQGISDELMDSFGCRQIVALAINYTKELVGTCIAYLPVDQLVVPDDALKTYAYIAGLAVKRRQAEEALKFSEAQYRLLGEHTTDGILLLDMDLNIIYVSPNVENIRGFTIQEAKKMPLEEHITPASLRLALMVFFEELPKVEADDGYNPVRILELEYYCKDGTTILTESKFSIIRDPGGKPISILGEARDITLRKLIESALQESEEKYRLLVENALEAIFIAKDGMIKFANRRTMELTGHSQKDLISKPFIEFVHSDDRGMVAERHVQRLKGRDVSNIYSFRIVCKAGDIKWVELSTALITWEGNPATLNFLKDITDRRRLEEEQQRVEKLESIGLLAGGIAHDFNNILTAILGSIGLARMEAAPGSSIYDSLKHAEKASLRAKDLTQQLLTFSKGGTPVIKTTSLTELLMDTTSFALRGSNVKCNCSIPTDLWHAEIDAGQVSQVVHNLVLNAQQSMPAGGVIELVAKNITPREAQRLGKGIPLGEGSYIRIAVTDHGCGIPAENLDRIFYPFFTTKHKGSGLGLATSFSIARNHGGHLSVKSELGVGSTFYVYLPASTEKSVQIQGIKEPMKAVGKARILVMDDEEDVREVAGRMLKHIGYKDIEFAADGAEAVKLYKAAMESGQPFSVVILDLTTPGSMGGKETIRQLLNIDHGVKAIVSSGYANESVMAGYSKYGFRGMVAKPYTLEELDKAVKDVIC